MYRAKREAFEPQEFPPHFRRPETLKVIVETLGCRMFFDLIIHRIKNILILLSASKVRCS